MQGLHLLGQRNLTDHHDYRHWGHANYYCPKWPNPVAPPTQTLFHLFAARSVRGGECTALDGVRSRAGARWWSARRVRQRRPDSTPSALRRHNNGMLAPELGRLKRADAVEHPPAGRPWVRSELTRSAVQW